jgi:hypothetical protein
MAREKREDATVARKLTDANSTEGDREYISTHAGQK